MEETEWRKPAIYDVFHHVGWIVEAVAILATVVALGYFLLHSIFHY